MTSLKCIICKKGLDPVFPDIDEDCHQPSNGLMFISYGNYGSTVFDPPGSTANLTFLQTCICDACIIVNKEFVFLVRKTPSVTYDYQEWDGNSE